MRALVAAALPWQRPSGQGGTGNTVSSTRSAHYLRCAEIKRTGAIDGGPPLLLVIGGTRPTAMITMSSL